MTPAPCLVTVIDPAAYRPTCCIYTGVVLAETRGLDNSRTREHIPPECIGGSVCVPAASGKANSALGAAVDRHLMTTGNVQCAAMALRKCVPNLMSRCLLTYEFSRDTVTGKRLHFRRDARIPKRIWLTGYQETLGADIVSPASGRAGIVYSSLRELVRGRAVADKTLISHIRSCPLEQPIEIPGGVLFRFQVSPLEMGLSETTRSVFLGGLFKIAYGFLYLYIGDSIFDQVFEPIRQGFRKVIEEGLDPDDMPWVRRYASKRTDDPMRFRPFHKARCATIGNAIEVEMRLFDNLMIYYPFPKVKHPNDSREIEFCFRLIDPPLDSAMRAVTHAEPSGTDLYVVFRPLKAEPQ